MIFVCFCFLASICIYGAETVQIFPRNWFSSEKHLDIPKKAPNDCEVNYQNLPELQELSISKWKS